MSDLTYVPTDEGWLYCAAHKDLFNGEIVGYALGSRITTELVSRSLFRAVAAKRPPRGLIHHSDRGSQYCSPALPEAARSVRHEGLDEQKRQLLRQRPYGELLGHAQERAHPSPSLHNQRGGNQGDHRIHRGLLQSDSAGRHGWVIYPLLPMKEFYREKAAA